LKEGHVPKRLVGVDVAIVGGSGIGPEVIGHVPKRLVGVDVAIVGGSGIGPEVILVSDSLSGSTS
jgi:hypothetical protein